MKVLQAGSNSIHVQRYCEAYRGYCGPYLFATEDGKVPEGAEAFILASFRGNPLRWIVAYIKLKQFIAKHKPDVIHIHQVNRFAWILTNIARSLTIPTLVTAWGSDVLLVPQRSIFHRKLVSAVLRNAQVITGDSRHMLDEIKRLIPDNNRLEWLQYGIDPIKPGAKEKIVYSNRLHKKLYRIDQVIRLFAEFVKHNPEWRLVIGAEGEETEQLKILANSLLREHQYQFVGWVDAASNASWYARSSIYISIPESDGTSVSLLEALSASCIPIVSDIAVSHEWIEDGVNGVIYRLQNSIFDRALSLEREKCNTINAELVEQHALRNATLKRFNELYKSITS
jgi:glycosyltransferase involved in cell wall biosynthesis